MSKCKFVFRTVFPLCLILLPILGTQAQAGSSFNRSKVEQRISGDKHVSENDVWVYVLQKRKRVSFGFVCLQRVGEKCVDMQDFEFRRNSISYGNHLNEEAILRRINAIRTEAFSRSKNITELDDPWMNFYNNFGPFYGSFLILADVVTAPLQLAYYGGDWVIGGFVMRRLSRAIRAFAIHGKKSRPFRMKSSYLSDYFLP